MPSNCQVYDSLGSRGGCRVARDGGNLVDATCPLLLQTSLKLYGIYGHVVLTFGFEGWARSRSSPSASAQYISASLRYWRLWRSDFAPTVRRANSFALVRYFSICDCTAGLRPPFAKVNVQVQTSVPHSICILYQYTRPMIPAENWALHVILTYPAEN
jgi:hypothetical protein